MTHQLGYCRRTSSRDSRSYPGFRISSTMERIKYAGVMAYTKKPEFGGAQVQVQGLQMDKAVHSYIAQRGSAVIVDGKEIESVFLDVETLYSTGHMKKK